MMTTLEEQYLDAAIARAEKAEARVAELETEVRNWKTATEANRDAAMGFQDTALILERRIAVLEAEERARTERD